MNERSCFVISPIGSEGSKERLDADKFLGLIKDVAELHTLRAFRADEENNTFDINADVIDWVLHSDLCVIDLTGLNPNVMYEFGMRYHTGLPYIVCAKKDTKLPFDIISRRTIFYGDLDITNDYNEAKKSIRNFINKFEEKDYQNSSIIGLNDLYQMLGVILEKIDKIEINNTQYTSSQNNSIEKFVMNDEVDELLKQLDPSEAFQYAYSTNNIRLAEQLLEYCRNQPSEYFLNKLRALTTLGSQKAAEELMEYIDNKTEITNEGLIETIGCLISCFSRLDSASENMKRIEDIFLIAENKISTNKERAALYNQKGRFYFSAKMFDEAKQNALNSIKLNDEEPAYFYNYAAILDYLGEQDYALKYVKKVLSLQSEDSDHLTLACKLLKSSKDPSDVELYDECIKRLSKISPYKARLLRFEE